MARLGLPNIDIEFVQKAVTAVQRSERGILAIIVKDNKEHGITKFVYRRATDVQKSDYETEANYTDIQRAFNVAVNKVYVFRCNAETEANTVVKELEKVRFNYICTNDANYQSGLATYAKQYNTEHPGHKIVAVVANVETKPDSKFVVNIKGTGGTLVEGGTVTAASYTIRVASTLANLPMNRSLTYYVFGELASWDDSYIEDGKEVDYWIDNGWLTLINDDEEVKCGRAVNSLTTFTRTDTEDMSHIIIVESMNMILEDIYTTFKDYYVGKYKNTLSNQRLFISSVNTYFRQLATSEILDPDYDNRCDVDATAQRNAWTAVGKSEAEDWDDNKVIHMPFRTNVFITGDCKIADCIEDLSFKICLA